MLDRVIERGERVWSDGEGGEELMNNERNGERRECELMDRDSDAWSIERRERKLMDRKMGRERES